MTDLVEAREDAFGAPPGEAPRPFIGGEWGLLNGKNGVDHGDRGCFDGLGCPARLGRLPQMVGEAAAFGARLLLPAGGRRRFGRTDVGNLHRNHPARWHTPLSKMQRPD